MHIPFWANKPQADGTVVLPVLAALQNSCLTRNDIANAASVLLWFQARDSFTERAEQGGCLKVMFSQIPHYSVLTHTHPYTHTHTHAHTGPEGVETLYL